MEKNMFKIRLFRKTEPEFDPFDIDSLKSEEFKEYLCGFSLKTSKIPNKVCIHECRQESRVFCDSTGFCSLKVENKPKLERI